MPALPEELRTAVKFASWTPDRLERWIRALPKVETHLHLDGALSPETVRLLAHLVPSSPLRGLSAEEVRRRVVVDAPRPALGDVLAAFDAFYPLLKSSAAVEMAAYEAAREAERQGVIYHELRFAPVLQAAPGFSARDALDAALRGLRRGRADFGVDGGVIVCLLRPFSVVSREANAEMASLAVQYAGHGVVGLDVADAGPGDELLSSYGDWLKAGKAAGLGLTAHAGEAPRGSELDDALALGVDRLGHAVRLRDRPDLVTEVKRRGLPVEANPTSNLRTGAVASYGEHPLRAWYDAGLKITVSTDDPGVFGVDLNHEYRVLARELRFTAVELLEVSWNGLDSVFAPEETKRELAGRFEARALAALSAVD